jgi:hydrogenase nickel incorporation protein HypB
MCTTCGCVGNDARFDGEIHQHKSDGLHWHVPGSDEVHSRGATDSPTRLITLEQDILARNDILAAHNRRALQADGIFAVNLVSSPGSGKTTLLEKTILSASGWMEIGVIEGDQQTSRDAERIRATGARAIQINTGRGCHLDAHMVGHAIARLAPGRGSVLMIENVGNLVCPAAFDLGEAHKVVVLSVTEGDDKPLKYPDMFRRASLVLLSKIDLLPYVEFDVERCIEHAHRIHPDIDVIRISAATGEGFSNWMDWIKSGVESARSSMSVPAGGAQPSGTMNGVRNVTPKGALA